MDVIHLTIYVKIIPVFFLIFEEMGQFCPSLINNNNSTKCIIGFWCILIRLVLCIWPNLWIFLNNIFLYSCYTMTKMNWESDHLYAWQFYLSLRTNSSLASVYQKIGIDIQYIYTHTHIYRIDKLVCVMSKKKSNFLFWGVMHIEMFFMWFYTGYVNLQAISVI